MNPATCSAQQQLIAQLLEAESAANLVGVQLAVAPTFLHLQDTKHKLDIAHSTIDVIAQDVAAHAGTGAYTGDISAELLLDSGISITLIGHSERRIVHHESGDILKKKLKSAADAGLTIILCVGETLPQREAGQAEQVVLAQIDELFASITLEQWQTQLMLAYEPVWAIGTGKTAKPEDAEAMHLAIRKGLERYDSSLAIVPLLYGGSVKPDNAASLAACAHIDGALVGGASLDANSFIQIAQAFADVNSVG